MFVPSPECLAPDLDPRMEMAMLARALWREGYDDHADGHISRSVGDGTLLCTPYRLAWEEIRPEHILRIDLEGHVLEGEWDVPAGIPLHLALHAARPNAGVALHHHPKWGRRYAALGRLPGRYDQSAVFGGGRAALVPYEGAVIDRKAADATVAQIGEAELVVLANHGVFILAPTIRGAYLRAVAFEMRCDSSWHVEAAGGAQEFAPEYLEFFEGMSGNEFRGYWESAVRREMRLDPSLYTPQSF